MPNLLQTQSNSWLLDSFLWVILAHFSNPQKGTQKEGFSTIPPSVAVLPGSVRQNFRFCATKLGYRRGICVISLNII